MENFIVILISIGFVVYNIYRNFQKEMVKSKSRKPYARAQSVPTEQKNTPKKHSELKRAPIEGVYIPEMPAEVIAAQERRRQQKVQRPIPLTKIQETDKEKKEIEFDLREAVIHAAILERPYK